MYVCSVHSILCVRAVAAVGEMEYIVWYESQQTNTITMADYTKFCRFEPRLYFGFIRTIHYTYIHSRARIELILYRLMCIKCELTMCAISFSLTRENESKKKMYKIMSYMTLVVLPDKYMTMKWRADSSILLLAIDGAQAARSTHVYSIG